MWDQLKPFFDYGLLGLLLVLVGWGGVACVRYLRVKVVEPLVDSTVTLIKTLQEHQPKQTEALRTIEALSQEQVAHLERIRAGQVDTAKELQTHRKWAEEAIATVCHAKGVPEPRPNLGGAKP